MNDNNVKFVKGYRADAGVDIVMQSDGVIPVGFSRIPLGVKYQPQAGEAAVVVARTSTLNAGLFVPIGIIDAYYMGEISAWVFNSTNEPYKYKAGDRLFSVVNFELAITRVSYAVIMSGHREDSNIGSTGGHSNG
jgi:dUTPase